MQRAGPAPMDKLVQSPMDSASAIVGVAPAQPTSLCTTSRRQPSSSYPPARECEPPRLPKSSRSSRPLVHRPIEPHSAGAVLSALWTLTRRTASPARIERRPTALSSCALGLPPQPCLWPAVLQSLSLVSPSRPPSLSAARPCLSSSPQPSVIPLRSSAASRCSAPPPAYTHSLHT
jgi:hypothetical protein